MITYDQVENLPADHPLYQAFMAEVNALDLAMGEAIKPDDVAPHDVEGSFAEFERYIAGDR